MTATESRRDIIEIDEELCDGCGLCLKGCAEEALALIDGKARLVSDDYCDGLGACLARCPAGALKIIKRPAPAFVDPADRRAAPGSAIAQAKKSPALFSWPVQLRLVRPGAAAFDRPEWVLAADCSAFAASSFQETFLTGDRPLLIACPKLDDLPAQIAALTEVIKAAPRLEEINIVIMSVPCCGGLGRLAEQALRESGRTETRRRLWVVSLEGAVKEEFIR